MTTARAAARYGTVPIVVHWASAVLVAWLLVSGFRIADTADLVEKAQMLRLHVAAGFATALLMVVRVVWWLLVEPAPAAVGSARQARLARTLHGFVYLTVLGMVASGVAMMVSSGAGAAVIGGPGLPSELWPDLLADVRRAAGRTQHGIGARLMLALVGLHITAALYHQVVLKDRIMARMGLGT